MAVKNEKFVLNIFVAILAVMLSIGSAQSATVSWSSRGDLPNSSAADSEILNTYTTELATLITGTTSTVNGVTFYSNNGPNNGGSVYASWNGGWWDSGGNFSGQANWSGELKAVMADRYYTFWNVAGILRLNNLTIGRKYKVQLLGYTIAGTGRVMEISSGGVSTGQWDAGGLNGDPHWYYTATFTADATTQDFNIGGVSGNKAYLSAVNVRFVGTLSISDIQNILAQAESIINQEESKGRGVDYWRLRHSIAYYFLRVAYMAQPSNYNIPDAYNNAMIYLNERAPQLLTNVQAFVNDPNDPEFAIPEPNIQAPWSLDAQGNIIANGEPVMLSGVIWQHELKDLTNPMSTFAMNSQESTSGPKYFVEEVNDGYQFIDNFMTTSHVRNMRSSLQKAQDFHETYGIHTLGGYTLRGFSVVDNHNAWMDTKDGREILSLTYQGMNTAFGDYTGTVLKTANLANEWTFWTTSNEAMAGFRSWLQMLHGNIATLNSVWGSSYADFNDVPPPFTSDTHGIYQPRYPEGIYRNRAPYWDWCCYNAQRASNVLQWMDDEIHTRWPGMITHTKLVMTSGGYRSLADNFIQGIDPQRLYPINDYMGTDASYMSGNGWKHSLFVYDYMKSICPSKPIIDSEMHATAENVSPDEIRRCMYQYYVHGQRMNWIFILTKLAVPVWWNDGLNNGFNLGVTPYKAESFALVSADLRRLAGGVSAFVGRDRDVLIFYDNVTDFEVPDGSGNSGNGIYASGAERVYESLLYHDVRVGVVTEQMLSSQLPVEPLIILCNAQYVYDNTVSNLLSYLNSGGTVLLLGNNNLKYDQYGRTRSQSAINQILNHSNTIQMALNPSVYDDAWPGIFNTAGIEPPFETNDGGKRVWGVEILSVEDNNELPLVFLANTNSSQSKTFALKSNTFSYSTVVDMITGKIVDVTNITLVPEQVMLLQDNCYGIWRQGRGMMQDYNNDCRIDFLDFAIFAESWLFPYDFEELADFTGQWLNCNNPADVTCSD